MEIEIKDDKRLVIMWIPKSEENDNRIKILVESVIKNYSLKKYRVAVFHSGDESLMKNITNLLLTNI